MLHHSNSRHQRNRGSKLKTLLKVTVLLGVAVWLVYQVKHSYDKKNDYLNAAEDQLSHDDRSIFQGRKERAGSDGVGVVDKAVEINNQEEEKSGETVFEKDNTDSHDDDEGNTERLEAEEGQARRADGNAEAHGNDEDKTTDHSGEFKLDAESNSSDADSKSEVDSTGDDVPQNNSGLEDIAGEANGTPNEEKEPIDGSSSADQINASSNGSDGEQAENKEEVGSQAGSESVSDDTKAGTGDEHSAETLPDETGNIPAVHNENPQNGGSENLGDSSSEAVHIEIGSEHEGARTSSGTASGGAEKGNSVESNPSDGIFVEEKTETASGADEKGTATEVSGAKEANPEEGSAATEVHTDQAANTHTENSQEASAAEANGSLEETKPVENQIDGATTASSNGDQDVIKIETNTSTNGEHDEHQSGDASSGSSGSNDSGSEQTGKTETQ